MFTVNEKTIIFALNIQNKNDIFDFRFHLVGHFFVNEYEVDRRKSG